MADAVSSTPGNIPAFAAQVLNLGPDWGVGTATITASRLIIPLWSLRVVAPCPLCGTPARRIQSRYTRSLADHA